MLSINGGEGVGNWIPLHHVVASLLTPNELNVELSRVLFWFWSWKQSWKKRDFLFLHTKLSYCVRFLYRDKRRYFIPAKQPWRGWHKDCFTSCWRHIKRCDLFSDIFSLALRRYSSLCKNTLFITGTGRNHQEIQLHPMYGALGPERAAALPDFHALSGADNTGCFSGKGKATCWNCLLYTSDAADE